MSSKRLDSIADYRRHGYDLGITCANCGHKGELSSHTLVATIPQSQNRRIEAIERRLRCSKCGGRNVRCWPKEIVDEP